MLGFRLSYSNTPDIGIINNCNIVQSIIPGSIATAVVEIGSQNVNNFIVGATCMVITDQFGNETEWVLFEMDAASIGEENPGWVINASFIPKFYSCEFVDLFCARFDRLDKASSRNAMHHIMKNVHKNFSPSQETSDNTTWYFHAKMNWFDCFKYVASSSYHTNTISWVIDFDGTVNSYNINSIFLTDPVSSIKSSKHMTNEPSEGVQLSDDKIFYYSDPKIHQRADNSLFGSVHTEFNPTTRTFNSATFTYFDDADRVNEIATKECNDGVVNQNLGIMNKTNLDLINALIIHNNIEFVCGFYQYPHVGQRIDITYAHVSYDIMIYETQLVHENESNTFYICKGIILNQNT